MAQTKKISVKAVYGGIDSKTVAKMVLGEIPRVHVMDVYGTAVDTASGESIYGDWTSLLGRFEAVNPETGETMQSSTCFLPQVAMIPILTALRSGNAKSVTFAISIYATAAVNPKPGGSQFEYAFEELQPPTDDDPLVKLRALIAEQRKALAAPVAEPAPAPAAAAAPSKKR